MYFWLLFSAVLFHQCNRKILDPLQSSDDDDYDYVGDDDDGDDDVGDDDDDDYVDDQIVDADMIFVAIARSPIRDTFHSRTVDQTIDLVGNYQYGQNNLNDHL